MLQQRSVSKQTSDEASIAWIAERETTGILAYWPNSFAKSLETYRLPYSMKN